MKVFLSLFLALLSFQACCQLAGWDLPDSLRHGASEVVLSDDTQFEVIDIHNSRFKRRYRAVILDGKKEDRSVLSIFYSKFRTIKDARVKIYSISGELQDDVKMKDMSDYSAKGSSMAADTRVLYYEPVVNRYPYIIEVAYEVEYKGSMFYPVWKPQLEKQSILSSTLEVRAESEDFIRHLSHGVKPKISPTTKGVKLRWEIENLKAFSYEDFSYSLENYAPVVYTAPGKFQMDGVEGDMNTWDAFGKWIGKLNAGKNTLDQIDIDDFLQNLPTDASKMEKVRYVYDYLQDNTKYVSIQLGLGGWEPFESGFVHKNKYGDCKALSFYTKSLLEVAGINSFYTLIDAGRSARELRDGFPMSNFNHAILTVPFKEDTVWLECTSQTNPFGYLGTFTSDRKALMITNDGATIVRTKSYDQDENLQLTKAHLRIDENGKGEVKLKRMYNGLEIENNNFRSAYRKGSLETREWFYDYHDWGNVTLDSITIERPSDETVPTGRMEVSLKMDDAAVSSSGRLFVKPFRFTNVDYLDVKTKNRNVPIEVKYAFSQLDTIKVEMPATFYVEKELSPITIEEEYGSYFSQVLRDENGVVYIRKFVLKKGEYPANQYESFRSFIRKVQRHDRKKVVFVNKT